MSSSEEDESWIQNIQRYEKHPHYDNCLEAFSLYCDSISEIVFGDLDNGNLTKRWVKGSWVLDSCNWWQTVTPMIQWDNSQSFRNMVNIPIQ